MAFPPGQPPLTHNVVLREHTTGGGGDGVGNGSGIGDRDGERLGMGLGMWLETGLGMEFYGAGPHPLTTPTSLSPRLSRTPLSSRVWVS